MKVTMSMDCTPQELREFLGWPDVGPVQQEMLERVTKVMGEGGSGIDPVALMRPFLVPNAQAMEAMQKAFQQAMRMGTGEAARKAGKED